MKTEIDKVWEIIEDNDCIEYLEGFKSKLRLRTDEIIEFDKVIEQIKIGKKYKAICEFIEEELISIVDADGTAYSALISFKNIKRKYFPTKKNTKRTNSFEKAVKEIRDLSIADERRENEEKYDKWFKSLTILQQADVAYNFWDGASYEDKKEEYGVE